MKSLANKTQSGTKPIPGCQKAKTAEEELQRFSLPAPSPALRQQVVKAARDAWQAPAAKPSLWRHSMVRLALAAAASVAVIGLINFMGAGTPSSGPLPTPASSPASTLPPGGRPAGAVLPLGTAGLADLDADSTAAKTAEAKKKAEEARQKAEEARQKALGTRH
jgi:hypothetical protein